MGAARLGAVRGRKARKAKKNGSKVSKAKRPRWAHSKAVRDLPRLDIANGEGKECVLLLMSAPVPDCAMFWPPVLAWYPEDQLLGVVSNRLLPRKFIPMASSSGLLCGLRIDDVLGDGLQWPRGYWFLRAAVCDPGTGYQRKLPALKMRSFDGPHTPQLAHLEGLLKLEMTGNREQYSVHLLCSPQRGRNTVYTWHSGWDCHEWKESWSNGALTGSLAGEFVFRGNCELQAYDARAESWTAMRIPGARDWNDFPVPQGLEGYSYDGVGAFRYEHKVMVIGVCSSKQPGAAVLLEMPREEGEEGGHECKPVSWATADQFAENPIRATPQYAADWPLHGGDLLVMRAATFVERDQPVAFHLKHQTWLDFPTRSLAHLTPQAVCIYIPERKNPSLS